jgi:uncharacterized protein
MFDVESFRPEVAKLCRELNVSRLDLFGSAAGNSFCSDSDIDVLVEFDRDGRGLFDRYFMLKEGLEKLFGRSVDVVIEKSIRNPHFKASVDRSRRSLYAA